MLSIEGLPMWDFFFYLILNLFTNIDWCVNIDPNMDVEPNCLVTASLIEETESGFGSRFACPSQESFSTKTLLVGGIF